MAMSMRALFDGFSFKFQSKIPTSSGRSHNKYIAMPQRALSALAPSSAGAPRRDRAYPFARGRGRAGGEIPGPAALL